ncbi:hypothetical protein EHQ27_01795 [Leptospira wolffii]|nr:hypothetical protein EHQ27_01795 [Leptospira wolffii]
MKRLLELNILSVDDQFNYELTSVSLNKTYTNYVVEYNKDLEEKKAAGEVKSNKRKKKLDAVKSRKDNCLNEKWYWKNGFPKKGRMI